ncbi:MAG: SpoIIE family protein phosphatase [Chloroflexi bacterium]|nr:SpoIIE family protein phosphatase [Chloroflexota bacterium]
MEARISAARIGKYTASESGDTLEFIERPNGGLSFVLADGQWSGNSAKAISDVVTRKAISLLADGVPDGAAARAASDFLYTYRSGKVQATLNIISIDLQTKSLVITRNNPSPLILIRDNQLISLDNPSRPVGTKLGIIPEIREIPLEVGLVVVAFTDGLQHAGEKTGDKIDVVATIEMLRANGPVDPDHWSKMLLDRALELDSGRPFDDISIVVLAILKNENEAARRLTVSLPIHF